MSRSAHRRRVSFIMRRGNRKCIRIRFRVIHGDIVHMTLRCRLGRRPSVFVVVPVGGGGVGSDIIERLQVMATEPLLRNRAVDPSNLVPNRSTSESIDAKRLARTLGLSCKPKHSLHVLNDFTNSDGNYRACAYRQFCPYHPASLWHANRRSRGCTVLVGKHIGV